MDITCTGSWIDTMLKMYAFGEKKSVCFLWKEWRILLITVRMYSFFQWKETRCLSIYGMLYFIKEKEDKNINIYIKRYLYTFLKNKDKP